MSETSYVINVDQAHFELEVLQASLTRPVLVDFWATWCGPCKTLGPMLEKLAASYSGAFLLAKVDVDTSQELAAMFGIRSVPTVMLVKDGQIVDGFAGVLPENQLREFLDRHVQPLAIEEANEEAVEAQAVAETPEQAVQRLRQIVADDPDANEPKLDLVQALMRAGLTTEAASALQALPANLSTDSRAIRLRSQIDLASSLEGAPSWEELQRRVAANGNDWNARELLGVRLLLEGDPDAGLEQLLTILEHARDWNDGAAKKRLLAAFATLDDTDLVGKYRRRMASLLF